MLDSSLNPSVRRHNYDFWKFWMGQTISTLGSSFTGFALPLLIFQLTGSALNLALTVVTSVLPYLLFGLVIGAWADRVNRKRAMIATDCARALIITAIPLVFALGLPSVWWIYVVTFLNSTLSIGFDAAQFAAIPSLVKQDDFVRANGRLQASYSIAKVVGPLLAGLLIFVTPLPMLLLVDAASFLVSAVSLALIRNSFTITPGEKKVATSIRHDILEGLHYVLNHPILRSLTVLLLLINFILPTAIVQLVLLAKQWLAASDTQVGILYAGGSIGTVILSLVADRLRKRWSFGTFALGATMLQGMLIAGMALTHWYWAVLLLWTACGGLSILFNIGAHSLTQMIVPHHLLGRVITFTRVLTWSTASLGALLGGMAIERTNVAVVYEVIGVLTFFTALTFFLTPLRHAEQYLPKEQPSQVSGEKPLHR